MTLQLDWPVNEPAPAQLPVQHPSTTSFEPAAAAVAAAPPADTTATTPSPSPATSTAPPAGGSSVPFPESLADPSAPAQPIEPPPTAALPAVDSSQTTSVPVGPASSGATVEVRAGDSLWRIAAAHLPTDASDVEIAAEWPRWYAANQQLVGEDPDLIEIGWQLTPPAADDRPPTGATS